MRKILTTIIICALFITVLVGCKQEKTANLIAKDLDTNLNKLEVAVNKLDSVENKYLANPDIYSSLSATPNTTEGKYFALAFSNNATTTDIVKQTLIDKITDKLLQDNPNYDSQQNLTCKKYCDNNGNCYYTDCNGNNYCYNANGSCYDCGSIPTTCSYVGDTILESDNSDYVVTQLSIESDTDQQNSFTDESSNIESETNTVNTPNPGVKVFYFSHDSFAPIKLKYNPRYISQYNEGSINEQIESYLSKVQKLYAMSEDSIEANTTLSNCKQNIIDCVKEIKELNDCIISGSCEPTVEQLQALSNYILDIKTTTKRIKECAGELTKEINKISQANSSSMINSVDVMSSNYMRLINHIDTRVTYHKSAIATLEQIKYLLDNAVNNNEITDAEIEDLIQEFTINPSNQYINENSNKTNNSIQDDDNINNEDDNIYNDNDSNIDIEDNNDIVYDNNQTQDSLIENSKNNVIYDENNDMENTNLENDEIIKNDNNNVKIENNSENVDNSINYESAEQTNNNLSYNEEIIDDSNKTIEQNENSEVYSNTSSDELSNNVINNENITSEESVTEQDSESQEEILNNDVENTDTTTDDEVQKKNY